MKTTIFQSVFCILVFATTVLSSCIKEELPVTGTVSGRLNLYDPSKYYEKFPADSILMYLINTDYSPKTVNAPEYSESIIDSTFTLADGSYKFNNLPEGNYALYPVAGQNQYNFIPERTDSSFLFQINAKTQYVNVNFSAPLTATTNDNSKFTMRIYVVNTFKLGWFKYRRQSINWIPFTAIIWPWYSNYSSDIRTNEINFISYFEITDTYGFYAFVTTLTNNYLIDAHYSQLGTLETYKTSFWITWPDISNMPSYSEWEYDWTAGTIKKM